MRAKFHIHIFLLGHHYEGYKWISPPKFFKSYTLKYRSKAIVVIPKEKKI